MRIQRRRAVAASRNGLTLFVALAACGYVASAAGASEHAARPLLAACYAPGTPIEYVREIESRLFGAETDPPAARVTSRWGPAQRNVALTYSFPPDGLELPSTRIGEPVSPNVIRERLNAGFGSEFAWRALFRGMFERWGAITGNTYTEVSDDGAPWPDSPGPFTSPGAPRGDIRIVMGRVDGGGRVLAYNFFPSNGDMKLDSDETWPATPSFVQFRNLIAHEHGHGMGLLHVCPALSAPGGRTKLMEPFITSIFEGPQLDDIIGGHRLYGDRFESNGSPGGATPIAEGLFNMQERVTLQGLSLSGADDTDLFVFDPMGMRPLLGVTAQPTGFTYLEGPRGFGGDCTTGLPFDALRVHDVLLDVAGPDAGAALRSANATGLGGGESLAGIPLESFEPHFVRVRSLSQHFSAQLYDIEFSFGCLGDLNGDGTVGPTDLATLLSAWKRPFGPVQLAILIQSWRQCELSAP